MRPGNGVHGTGVATMSAADAKRLLDDSDTANGGRFSQWFSISPKQVGQSLYRILTTRRAEVNRDFIGGNRLRVRTTSGITTLCALRLWQKVVDLIDDLIGIAGQLVRGDAQ